MKFSETGLDPYFAVKKIWKKVVKEAENDRLDLNTLSMPNICRYLEYLVCDCDYNSRSHVFYEKYSNRKLSYDLLSKIAYEYILEHKDYFKKQGS